MYHHTFLQENLALKKVMPNQRNKKSICDIENYSQM